MNASEITVPIEFSFDIEGRVVENQVKSMTLVTNFSIDGLPWRTIKRSVV